ncbi:DUF5333 domain-containing protein [Shimia sp. R11_0]|uniref:DUF5333 domain-containing protein n=1 Tax=Shimia sp. R11_0 TaxID=2821096 RepID=UPI001ADB3A17|nr:DUF5333 domain-containing protein [Shimia sp. R11_0]MBO9477810.1 DUF5333 domain-containing protein [Shimia sp. R11_0]
MKPLMSAVLVSAILTGSMALANPPLREVKEIDEPLYWALVAFEISEVCDSIDARTVKGLSDGWGLIRKARQLGYSDEEIKSYMRSDTEKARMRARGEAYFKHKGASYDDPETFCALGRTEIERNSQIGVYLRAK